MNNEKTHQQFSFCKLLFSGVLLVGVFTIVGFFGESFWLFDLVSHFRFQYAVFLLVSVCIFLAIKRYKYLWLNALALIINLTCILPIYFEGANASINKSQPHTAMVLNLHYTNNEYELVTAYIEENKPDILLLLEYSFVWRKGLDSALKKYPSQIIETKNSPFGIGLYSKFAMHQGKVIQFGGTDIPSIKTTLDINGTPLNIFGVHWMPPFGRIGSEMRNNQMKELENHLSSDRNDKTMVLGDINMTPWSQIFQKFVFNTKLKNVRKGFGILATWPANLRSLGIPLDHGFVSQNIIIEDIETGSNFGSDHLPLKFTFGFDK
ncbi:MAG: endonuclease/exonuclease/phosphatase family protein [Nitrospinales bacterium]